MRRVIQVLSISVIVLMGALTLGASLIKHWQHSPMNLDEDYVVVVKKGDTLSKLAYQLEKQGILSSARWFILYARIREQTHLEIGEYLLAKQSSRLALLELLQSGDVINYKLTLVEGKTFKDFLVSLQANEKLTHHLDASQDQKEIIQQLGLDIEHPEGWFFPDTYQFVTGVSDRDILLQAYEKMRHVLDQQWQNRAKDLPYKTPYEALIMASIIEKETGVAYERPEIAGVFVRRLQKGMRLQTDPTVIYGLGDKYKGNIRRKHLRQKTPYNTYVINGLPPTPIAMPGQEAIYAALHPKAGNSLFFVPKGDGSHYFSATLAEHNKAVREYQINKRSKNYQSAPQKITK